MNEKQVYGALGGLAAFLILIALVVPRDRGPDVDDLIADTVAPLSDAVSGLSERMEAMEGTLGSLSEQVEAAQSSEALEALNARVDEAMAQAGALGNDIAAVKSALDDTNSAVAAVSEAATAAPAEQVSGDAASATEPTADAQQASSDTSGYAPGETALFADGALRMFVSRVDADAGDVRVSVAGEMKTLALGQSRTLAAGDDFCRITVASIDGNAASLDAVCGDDLPAPEGISVGNTAILADGAVRVFASRVTEAAARLSVNGEMVTLSLGRSAPVATGEDNCRVFLDAVDRGHAVVSAQCGDAVAVSDLAGPGSTVVLNDGALRVFVSTISGEAVRFAVNGQTLVSGASGDTVDVGDGCSVTVEDIADGQASFSHSCDG